LEKVIEMYAKRTREISLNPEIDYILCFKNQGPKSGASIPHAHSQVFASKLLPPDIAEELNLMDDYKAKHQSCPYCDVIAKEAKSERFIWEDENVIAIAPYASEYHYEAWIFTRRHLDNITKLSDREIASFAKAYHLILQKLYQMDLSFNAFLHQVISDRDQHFYFKIQPRDSIWAGVELGSGLIINTVPPEDAASFYRS
jgi:UDPglucose--hexose-1-phosphate uridylyltransferase